MHVKIELEPTIILDVKKELIALGPFVGEMRALSARRYVDSHESEIQEYYGNGMSISDIADLVIMLNEV